MAELDFNNIFSNEDINDYNLFIEKMKQLKGTGHTTKELLFLVYQYYQKYVTYNYDQLQIVKINRADMDEPGYKCNQTKEEINDRIRAINNISAKGELSLREIVNAEQFKEQGIIPFSKEEARTLLDKAFLEIEGRPLTERNREKIFANYGKIRHIPYTPARKSGILKFSEVKEHDEIIGTDTSDYPPVYNNQMLVDGVCSEYTEFEARICKDLGIKHRKVTGIGTTGHAWSLIYLEEEDRWVHFDMTMVKFYQDKWIKEHEPYNEQDWITASTSDILKMQPTRRIESIGGKKCNFSRDNYEKLDIDEYVHEEGLEH